MRVSFMVYPEPGSEAPDPSRERGRGSEPPEGVDRGRLVGRASTTMSGITSVVPARFTSDLATSETAIAFAWARTPRPRTPGTTFFSIRLAIEVVDFFRGKVALRKLRAHSAALGFPLDRNMAMVVTTDRLLIWRSARHSLRDPVLLGGVPRTRITSAAFPYVGGEWKVIRVQLEDGVRVQFFANPASADAFVDALNGRRGDIESQQPRSVVPERHDLGGT